jgi:phosphate-selective porin OprO/OprP
MKRNTARRWALATATAVAVALLHQGAWAQGAGTVLEEILDIMQKGGQITDEKKQELIERAEREARQAEADREKAIADATSVLMAGIENYKPFLRSSDGNFKLELGGRAQVNYAGAEEDAETVTGTGIADRFFLRRARFEVAGQLFRWIDFKVESDFTESTSLKDAYLDFRPWSELGVRAGQYKVPFSREELISSRLIDFVERSILNELAPARDFGVMAHGNLFNRTVAYQLGVFNGAGEDTADNNEEKDLAGRLVLAPFRNTSVGFLKNLELAGNFTWGDQDSVNSAQGRTTARTSTRFTYFAAHPTRGDRTRMGADVAWAWGPIALVFEYAEQSNERENIGAGGADLDDIVATGWYVAATWLITGEAKTVGGVVAPRRNFSPFAGKFGPGAWQLGVRYAQLDFESDDPVDFFDGSVTNGITGGGTSAENGVDALTVGLNWYFNPRVRAVFNWTRYWFDNALGTPGSCRRTGACSASQLGRGDDAYEIETSVQVWF